MTRKRDYGHKAADAQFCKGYTDEHGHWNNGFHCPAHYNGAKVQYCCGGETHRYCCIQQLHEQEESGISERQPPPQSTHSNATPMVLGILAGVAVVLVLVTVVVCYFVHCCPLYKRRKRSGNDYHIYDDEISTTFACDVTAVSPSGQDTDSLTYKHPDVELKTIQHAATAGECESITSAADLETFRREKITRKPTAPPSLVERDSGCYVSPTEFDSQTCLTSHDILNEEDLRSFHNHGSSRYSWPMQAVNEDIMQAVNGHIMEESGLGKREDVMDEEQRKSASDVREKPHTVV